MSIPNDPQQPEQPQVPPFDAPQAPAAPIDAPQSFDAPTAAYPAGGFAAEQPTVPQAPYGQPAYPAAPQPGYPQAPQDAYGQPMYGQPVAPAGPRPKTLAIIALVLAVVGLIVAFIPIANMFAGVLLLPAFVIAIIALVKKTQGGKGFSIAALIISVIGWIVSIVMIIGFFIAAAAVNFNEDRDFGSSSTPLDPEESATADETDDAAVDVEPGVYSEAAFIEASKPTVVRILSDAIPNATPELVSTMFPDEVLLALGQAIVLQDKLAGGLMDADQEKEFRDAFVDSMSESGGISTEAAAEFYDVVAAAARAHLVK